jgi:ribosomal protein L12E/L44/L45/RPP1/RPP2
VWTRTVNGRALHFYLAGINNQNFIMRDKETGTWWQQITGKALYGPLKGASLQLVLSDELTFGEWKSEFPDGKVLAQVPKYIKEYDPKWEPEVAKYPVPISFPGTPLKSRDVIVGLEMPGPGRAYPWETLVKQSPVVDRVNGIPLLVAVGPDGKSFRVFVSRIDGNDAEFFLKGETEGEAPAAVATPADSKPAASSAESKPEVKVESKTEVKTEVKSEAKKDDAKAPDAKPDASAKSAPAPPPKPWILVDTTTASEWNFQGCAISGPSLGKCLDRIPSLKDYWFDWRNYHPDTTIYKR